MSLAEVLAWKFDNAPGIRTRGGDEIFDWPERLGPQPTPEQIAQWTAEFEALPKSPTFEDIAREAEAAQTIAELRAVLAKAMRRL